MQASEAKDEQKGDMRDSRLSGPKRLARREEEFIRKQMARDALERCHETKLAYVQCASGALQAPRESRWPVQRRLGLGAGDGCRW